MGCELWIGWFAYKSLACRRVLYYLASPAQSQQDVEVSNTEARKHYYKSLNKGSECPVNLGLVISLIDLQTANRC